MKRQHTQVIPYEMMLIRNASCAERSSVITCQKSERTIFRKVTITSILFLSILLAVLLVPEKVFAAESIEVGTWNDLKQAVEQADDEIVIEIIADIPFENVLSVSDCKVTIKSKNGIKTLTSYQDSRHFNVSGSSAALILEDVTLDGVDNTQSGGGILVDNGAALELLNGVTIENCSANNPYADGGGVYVEDATLKIDGATITNNFANEYGGGIYATVGSEVTMNSGRITQNKSASAGGGIAILYNSEFTMNNGEISSNEAWDPSFPRAYNNGNYLAPGYGGGVYVIYNSNFTLNDGIISENTSTYCGGGVFVGTPVEDPFDVAFGDQSIFKMAGGTVKDNEAYYAGGGVCVRGVGAEFTMPGGSISNNTAWQYPFSDLGEDPTNTTGYGGGIYVISGTFTMGDANNPEARPVISKNHADSQGGGMYFISYVNFYIGTNVTHTIYNGEITENTAGATGGGVNAYTATIEMKDGLISQNTSGASGGGISLHSYSVANAGTIGSSFVMTGGTISENKADASGGGVYVAYTEVLDSNTVEIKSELQIADGDISGNIAGEDGGGIYVEDGSNVTLSGHTTVKNNRAVSEGGGIYSSAFTGFNSLERIGDYSGVVDTDYGNLDIDDTTEFAGNRAFNPYNPPSFASSMNHLKYATSSVSFDATGYIHTLNNYDINYISATPFETYRVIYHPNGGFGNDYEVAGIVVGTSHTILNNTDSNLQYTKNRHTFSGWNTNPKTSNVAYNGGDVIGDTIAADGVVNLYAVWRSTGGGGGDGGSSTNDYAVYYEAGNGVHNAKNIPDNDTGISAGNTYTIEGDDPEPTREGYIFGGWKVTKDTSGDLKSTYQPGNTFKMPSNHVTLTAIWESTEETPELNKADHYAYIVGYPDGDVKPNEKITRAESATILFRLLTETSRERYWSTSSNFPDVTKDTWFNNAVSTMTKANIVTGYPDGSFRPNENITRAEYASLIAKFDKSSYDKKNYFNDVNGHWAENYINQAAAQGWLGGYPDGSFKPNEYITRAEVMTLVNKVLERNPEGPSDLISGMIKWPDNVDQNAWYYLAIQEATNSHLHEKKANSRYEKWTALEKNPDWAAIESSWSQTYPN